MPLPKIHLLPPEKNINFEPGGPVEAMQQSLEMRLGNDAWLLDGLADSPELTSPVEACLRQISRAAGILAMGLGLYISWISLMHLL